MERIGLITFHAAYNHGSALQAYATQTAINRITDSRLCSIINYRTAEQKAYYNHLYRLKYGINFFARDIMQFPVRKKRKQRMANFEKFMKNYMDLTVEVSEPEEVYRIWGSFGTMVSGSDQIWSKHTCENEHAEWKYMDPYLQVGFKGKKVSYASSIGKMNDDELRRIAPSISEYDHIAVREQHAADRLSALLNRDITVVLDPTLLIQHEEWKQLLGIRGADMTEPYLLYYSLGGYRAVRDATPAIEAFARRVGVSKVVQVTPFTNFTTGDERTELHPECGPIEFLNYLESAKCVVTDSYHGTLFSANFGKDLYSLCLGGAVDYRKEELLGRIGLGHRVVKSLSELEEKSFMSVDYDTAHSKLEGMRSDSYAYLTNALAE